MIRSAVAFAALSCCLGSFFAAPLIARQMRRRPLADKLPAPTAATSAAAKPAVSASEFRLVRVATASRAERRADQAARYAGRRAGQPRHGPLQLDRSRRQDGRRPIPRRNCFRLDHAAGGVDRSAHPPLRVPAAAEDAEHRQGQDPRRRDVRRARADPRLETVERERAAPSTGRRISKVASTRCSARPANRPTAWATRPTTGRSTARWPSCSATWSRF